MKNSQIPLHVLTAYLPYGVKTNRGELIGIRDWIGWGGVFKFEYGDTNVPISNIQLLLRPMSDLTDEHIEKLDLLHPFSVMNFEYIKTEPLRYCYPILLQLLEWHYDIFGAIQQGWALDLNTVQQ